MRELRDAYRALARSRGFTAVAVLSLALALGLNTTVFAVLDAFIHPYVPYHNPERILRFGIAPNYQASQMVSRTEVYSLLREQARFVSEIAFWDQARRTVVSPNSAEETFVADVSPNFFRVIGVVPSHGRSFLPAREANVAIVSHQMWLRQLGRKPLREPISISIDGHSHTVVGVMPPSMNLPSAAEVWRPLAAAPESPQLLGRLAEGMPLADAKAQLALFARDLTARYPQPYVRFEPYATTLEPEPLALTRSHAALAASGALILLIACANLANLMLARGVARRGELALRMAIGASRGALIRQLTTEAALLAVAGGILGLMWASWGVGIAVGRIATVSFITLSAIHFSWRVFAFAFLASSVTVLLVGLVPALRASDLDVAEPLKEGAATIAARGPRRYSTLAITQVALALTLLVSAGVLTRSAVALAGRDIGYPVAGLYRLFVGGSRDDPAGMALLGLLARVRAIAGVRWAATERWVSLYPGATSDRGGDATALTITYRRTSADYFRTLGVPILRGRDFDNGDNEVVILNEAAAATLWPGENPVGRLVQLERGTWRTVVGVSRNVGEREGSVFPVAHVVSGSDTAKHGTILFRVDGTSPGVTSDVNRVARAMVGPGQVIILNQEGQGAQLELSAKQFLAGLFVFLGLSALGLAVLGLYGVLAYTVSRRTREFGIRIALGATQQQLFRMVLHDGAVMFLAGTAIGAFTALAMARLVDTLLYRVGFSDVWSLIAAELVLCGVALMACLGPALRAARANPLEILRAA